MIIYAPLILSSSMLVFIEADKMKNFYLENDYNHEAEQYALTKEQYIKNIDYPNIDNLMYEILLQELEENPLPIIKQ